MISFPGTTGDIVRGMKDIAGNKLCEAICRSYISYGLCGSCNSVLLGFLELARGQEWLLWLYYMNYGSESGKYSAGVFAQQCQYLMMTLCCSYALVDFVVK